jgi:hypothetical protein
VSSGTALVGQLSSPAVVFGSRNVVTTSKYQTRNARGARQMKVMVGSE